MQTRLGCAARTRSHAGRTPRVGPRAVPAFVRTAPLGVNVSGYLDTESGMGEAARASIRSLEAAGIPVALNNVPSQLRTRDTSYAGAFGDANPHPFNLVHLNADNMGWFADGRGRALLPQPLHHRLLVLGARGVSRRMGAVLRLRRRSVGGERLRPRIVRRLVAGAGRAHAAARSSCQQCRPLGRAHFGLPAARHGLPLHVRRLEPDGAQEPERRDRAFRRARFAHDEAVLVLKFTNAEYDRDAVRAPPRAGRRAARASFSTATWIATRSAGLLATADCYVSPHRSEGFGLTMLESMALGKPVIATAYSGNMDFMTEDEQLPRCRTRLLPLERDYGPYMRGADVGRPRPRRSGAPDAARRRAAGARADARRRRARSSRSHGSATRRSPAQPSQRSARGHSDGANR